MATQNLEIIISARDQFSRTISSLKSDIGSLGQKFKLEMGILRGATDIAKESIFGLGAGVISLGAYALKSAAGLEMMMVSLKTAMGGNKEAAQKAFDVINKFAARTPYELDEVMRSFIKLKNMGLQPSEKALTAYGDTASALGKSLNDMIEAVADAATGEFERLKEFGIRASVQGDNVKLTFQGVTTTVKNKSGEIEQYLIKLGETKFKGGMEEGALTLSGLISTLASDFKIAMANIAIDSGLLGIAKDAVTNLTKYISENKDKITDWATNAVSVANDKIKEWYESVGGKEGISEKLTALKNTILNDVVPAVQGLISIIISATKFVNEHSTAVLIAVLALIAFRTVVLVNGVIGALSSFATMLGTATKATLALNTALMAHPWGIIITVGIGSVLLAKKEIANLEKDIENLEKSSDNAFASVRKLQEKAKTLPKGSDERKDLLQKAADIAKNIAKDVSGGRATGGSVMRGKPYMVGENGPETFVPSQSGSIEKTTNNSSVNNYYSFDMRGATITNEDDLIRKIQNAIGRRQELISIGSPSL